MATDISHFLARLAHGHELGYHANNPHPQCPTCGLNLNGTGRLAFELRRAAIKNEFFEPGYVTFGDVEGGRDKDRRSTFTVTSTAGSLIRVTVERVDEPVTSK